MPTDKEPTPVDTTKCFEPDCPYAPVWAPKLRVPAKDWPLDQHNPLEIVLGITFCARCAPRFKRNKRLMQFLDENEPLREILEILTRSMQPPDFNRAYVELVALDSEEYLMLKSAGKIPPAPPMVH